MKLNQISIKNFRNIESVTYDLSKLNVFTGPNGKGKTNTILAVYWALSDYLMDSSSDYPSFKPHHDTAQAVSVELLFETFSFRKDYYEKWVKTRGTTEVRMEGHTTDYYIDDVKYPVTEAKRLLLDSLGLSDAKVPSKVDIIRSVIDPYYLASQLEWKDLRVFIIDLVGDVDDETVLNSREVFSTIKDDLAKHKYNTEPLTKMYRQGITSNKKQLLENENYLSGYSKVEDVEPDTLNKAEFNLELLDGEIATLKKQAEGAINPNIQKVEAELNKVRSDFLDSREKDTATLRDKNKKTNELIDKATDKLNKHREDLNKLQLKSQQEEFDLKEYESKKLNLENQIKRKKEEREKLGEQWSVISDTEYVPSVNDNSCPHCGAVLNADEIEAHKYDWEENKKTRLDNIEVEGSNLSNEITNLEFKLNELKKPEVAEGNVSIAIDYEKSGIESTSKELEELRSQLVLTYVSDETKALETKGIELGKKLEEEKAVKTDEEIKVQIESKQKEKIVYQEVVNEHNAYLTIQKKSEEVKKTIEVIQKELVENESKLMLLEEFIKTKLELLKDNVKSVFGDLEFVLIETNIKEGSYNEVCYPLILGTKTPFKDGSGAEKIITGVNVIESVKARLGVPNLPIIFDEVDKLDTNTLNTKVVTNSQLLSTRVDDVNYSKVELVSQ